MSTLVRDYATLFADATAATQKLLRARRDARQALLMGLVAANDGRADIAAEKIEIALTYLGVDAWS